MHESSQLFQTYAKWCKVACFGAPGINHVRQI